MRVEPQTPPPIPAGSRYGGGRTAGTGRLRMRSPGGGTRGGRDAPELGRAGQSQPAGTLWERAALGFHPFFSHRLGKGVGGLPGAGSASGFFKPWDLKRSSG